jgi:hypothetical protein
MLDSSRVADGDDPILPEDRIMARFRFHIGNLLILVLFMGVGFAGLREANDLWDSGIFTLTLGVLLTAVLFAVHRTGLRRAFWLGFALFGWSYLGLASIRPIESQLLTTKALAYLDSKIPGRDLVIQGVMGIPSRSVTFTPDGGFLTNTNPGVFQLFDAATGVSFSTGVGTSENFRRIGHSLLALIVAWLGGRISALLFVRSSGGDYPSD